MTTENPTIDLIDIYSREDRLMLADHYEESGDDETARILRAGQPFFHEGKLYSLYEYCDKIRSELRRLGCHDMEAYADESLPLGYVRVSDGYSRVEGPAVEILSSLESVSDAGDNTQVWEATWESLEFPERIRADRFQDYHHWMGLHKFGKTTEDGKWSTIACACNEGWKWRYYPNDESWLAGNHNLGWSDWYGSEEEALTAAVQEGGK